MYRNLFLSLATVQLLGIVAWAPMPLAPLRRRAFSPRRASLDDNEDADNKVDRASFDQAGASLIEEEDRKRMEQMGDFDTNDSVRWEHSVFAFPIFVLHQHESNPLYSIPQISPHSTVPRRVY